MQKIIMTKGLPASGKSTWAKEMCAQGYKRVNKDDLRAMVDNGKWSKSNEKFILEMRDFMVRSALKQGHSIIVDDTNLDDSHIKTMNGIALEFGRENNTVVAVEIKDFTDVPLEVCLARDAQRPNPVGRKVILGMYKKFIQPASPKPKYDPQKRYAIICDLDGTLALHNGRSPYDADKCDTDIINDPISQILYRFQMDNHDIIFCSGREDKYREKTKTWLAQTGLSYSALLMRKTGDMRNDAIVKEEIYEAEIKDKYNVLFVLDDRDRVVDMWRSKGLTCLQVDYGSF